MSLDIGERIVVHGVDWQSFEPEGRPQDGETDFVVARLDHASLEARTRSWLMTGTDR